MYFCSQDVGSIVLQGKKGSIVLQILQNYGLKDNTSMCDLVVAWNRMSAKGRKYRP